MVCARMVFVYVCGVNVIYECGMYDMCCVCDFSVCGVFVCIMCTYVMLVWILCMYAHGVFMCDM